VNILTVNLLFSTIVFTIAAKLYLLPMLPRLVSVVIPTLIRELLGRHPGARRLAAVVRRSSLARPLWA